MLITDITEFEIDKSAGSNYVGDYAKETIQEALGAEVCGNLKLRQALPEREQYIKKETETGSIEACAAAKGLHVFMPMRRLSVNVEGYENLTRAKTLAVMALRAEGGDTGVRLNVKFEELFPGVDFRIPISEDVETLDPKKRKKLDSQILVRRIPKADSVEVFYRGGVDLSETYRRLFDSISSASRAYRDNAERMEEMYRQSTGLSVDDYNLAMRIIRTSKRPGRDIIDLIS